jgi:ubiquinone/menaquinone biosynthesis C-methylase UbiE
MRYLSAVSTNASGAAVKEAIAKRLCLSAGHRVLDVGCGIGTDVRLAAGRVKPTGLVIGVDRKLAMITTAKELLDQSTSTAYVLGDAGCLPFSTAFDACRTERTLQHVNAPVDVLREMVRVTRPGGTVVAAEPDWATLVVDHPDEALARKVQDVQVGGIRHPYVGRELYRMFVTAGLRDVEVEPVAMRFDLPLYLATAGRRKFETTLTPDEIDRYFGYLDSAYRGGTFFASQQVFIAHGQRLYVRGTAEVVPLRDPEDEVGV